MKEGTRVGSEEETGAVKQRVSGAAAGPFGRGSGDQSGRCSSAVSAGSTP